MLAERYSEVGRTIFEARYAILLTVVLFAVGICVGWIYSDRLAPLEEVTQRLIREFGDLDARTFIVKIFLHNLIAAYATNHLIVLFGLIPAFAAFVNGVLVGWISAKATGVGPADIIAALAPHGIFELPAVMLAWGVGLWRGADAIVSGNRYTWKQRWLKSNKIFFLVVVPLLMVAAVIEGRLHIYRELVAP